MHACAQCLLDSLLLARDEAGAGMERRSLRDELMTLLVAGQETSAINLAWSLAFLAHHPGAQERAAQEVQQQCSTADCSGTPCESMDGCAEPESSGMPLRSAPCCLILAPYQTCRWPHATID